MYRKDFQDMISKTFNRITELEAEKHVEYVGERSDRLAHFKEIADFRSQTAKQALAGEMIKHTKSIYDMIDTEEFLPLMKWYEKIDDHIVYLLLLKGLIIDELTVKDAEPTLGGGIRCG